MAGAATVAVRPKNGNAVIAFRPESAGKFWRACPGPDRRPVEFYPQGGAGARAVCPIAGMAPGNAAPLPAAAPSGAAPATAGGGGESSSSRKPGAGASPRSVPLRLRQRPDRLRGRCRDARPPLEGGNVPPAVPFADGLKRAAGFRPPPHNGPRSTDSRRAVRQGARRYGACAAGARSARGGALYTGRAGGQGRAATATPPGGATPGFQDHGARS